MNIMNSFAPFRIRRALPAFGLLPPVLAQASPATPDSTSFVDGLLHPLAAFDHWVIFVGLGIWAAQLGRRARWFVPAVFGVAMVCGAGLGMNGAQVPGTAAMVFTSVLLFTLLVLGRLRWTFALVAGPLGVLAIYQGVAHGAMLPAAAQGVAFAGGFGLAAAALAVVGIGIGDWVARHRPQWMHSSGSAVSR